MHVYVVDNDAHINKYTCTAVCLETSSLPPCYCRCSKNPHGHNSIIRKNVLLKFRLFFVLFLFSTAVVYMLYTRVVYAFPKKNEKEITRAKGVLRSPPRGIVVIVLAFGSAP